MIDQYPSQNGVLTSLIWRKTMSGGETSLSGYDNASQALSYTPGQEQVYLNGILLVRGDDYTATNGTSITGLSALSASDFVQVNCYNNFSVASVPTTSLTGTVSNAQLANSSITINGSAVSLGGSTTIAGGSAQDDAPTSPTEGQLWLDTNGTLATTAFTEKATLTTTGDIYYASSANTPARLGIGSTDQVLTVSGGVPAWATPSGGKVLQVVNSTLTSGDFSTTSTSYSDTGLTLTITPSLNTSKIMIFWSGTVGSQANSGQANTISRYQLLRGATVLAQKNFAIENNTGATTVIGSSMSIAYYDSPATTSATTYKIQAKQGGLGAVTYMNASTDFPAILTAFEIGA